jgi:hypothetical protein
MVEPQNIEGDFKEGAQVTYLREGEGDALKILSY